MAPIPMMHYGGVLGRSRAERSPPPADIAKLMYKRINSRDIMAFCKKHKVSSDWLLCGELRGLHRMSQEAKAAPQEMPEALRKEAMALFSALPAIANRRTRLPKGTAGERTPMKRRRRSARKRNG
jgi:hypothetical protein